MSTIADFNRTVDQLLDLASELGIHATSAEFQDESEDDEQPDQTLTVFFDHPEANPLTMNAKN